MGPSTARPIQSGQARRFAYLRANQKRQIDMTGPQKVKQTAGDATATEHQTTAAEAVALGISRQSLYKYRRANDWPATGDMAAKREWIAARRAGVVGDMPEFAKMNLEEARLATARATAALTAEKALIEALERREKEGELVRADDVRVWSGRRGTVLQTKMLGLPGEVRQRQEAGESPGAIEAWLTAHIRELLIEACQEGRDAND